MLCHAAGGGDRLSEMGVAPDASCATIHCLFLLFPVPQRLSLSLLPTNHSITVIWSPPVIYVQFTSSCQRNEGAVQRRLQDGEKTSKGQKIHFIFSFRNKTLSDMMFNLPLISFHFGLHQQVLSSRHYRRAQEVNTAGGGTLLRSLPV